MTKNLPIQMLPLHSSTQCKNCNQITIASVQFIDWTYMQACNTVKPAYNGQNIICTFVGLKLILFQSKTEYTFWKKFQEEEYGTNLSEHSNCFLFSSLYSASFLFKQLLFIADKFAWTAQHSPDQRNFLVRPMSTSLKVLVRQVSLY